MLDDTHTEQTKQALHELRENRAHFSTASYALLTQLLLDNLKKEEADNAIITNDEIRLVTVMFVDVKDSTALAQTLDTGDWKGVIGEAHKRIAEVVAQWEGQIGQYLGDGTLVFFGAQRSDADDPMRAVSCALAIQDMAQNYDREVQQRHAVDFAVRVGISTGRVAVGMIGAANKQERLAVGPATNLANRLQSIATAGAIYIDAATYSRVRNQFELRTHAPTYLKGYVNPVQYYEVLARRQQGGTRFTNDSLNGLLLPLVGRAMEMQAIGTALHRTRERGGFYALTLSGEMGLGKSRLLQETVRHLPDNAYTELVMIGRYENRKQSYSLLRDMLKRLCHLTDDIPLEQAQERLVAHITGIWDDADALIGAEIIGYLADFGFETSAHVQPLRSGGGEMVAFAWVARWLHGLADGRPLLLLVDNLHWADADSVSLLNYLVRDAQDLNGLLIAAGRPDWQRQHDEYLHDHPQHEVIKLHPLQPDATRTLIQTVLEHVERTPVHLADIINERADGNPLFVQEFLSMLFDGDVFKPIAEQQWRFDPVFYDESALPNGLIGVLQARLDDLHPEMRQIIQIAAVIGQTFWLGAVEDILGTEANLQLASLVSRGLIDQKPQSIFEHELQYSFRHSLYRDVAYEMIPRAKREQFHRQVAQWLVTHIAGKSNYFGLLGDHFADGGEHDAALYAYLEAAQARLHRGMVTETLALIERGLSTARNVERDVAVPMVSRLWALQAQALNDLDRYDEATAAGQTTLMLLEEVPQDQLAQVRVQAARILGTSYRSLGRYDEAFEALGRAYEHLTNMGNDQSLLASVLRSFGVLCFYQGKLDESHAFQQRAYVLAQTTQQEDQVTSSLAQLGLIAFHKGQIAEALGYFERVLQVNKRRDYTHLQSADLRNIGMVHFSLMHYERALQTFNKADRLRQSISTHDHLLLAYRGSCLVRLGEADEGLRLIEDAIRNGHRDVYNSELIHLALIRALVHIGDYDRSETQIRWFMSRVEQRNPLLYGRAYYQLSRVYRTTHPAQAPAALHEALEYERNFGGRDLWRILADLAEVTDDPKKRQIYRQEAAELVQTMGAGLHNHPELQEVFWQQPTVQVLTEAIPLR